MKSMYVLSVVVVQTGRACELGGSLKNRISKTPFPFAQVGAARIPSKKERGRLTSIWAPRCVTMVVSTLRALCSPPRMEMV